MSKFEENIENLLNEANESTTEGSNELTINQKSQFIKDHKTGLTFDRITKDLRDAEKIKRLDISKISEAEKEKIYQQNELIFNSEQLPFITKGLTDFVKFSSPNLILIGAVTGGGKTTVAANIMRTLSQNKFKTLYITNEEIAANVYNRISSLEFGYNYNDKKSFTDEMKQNLLKNVEKLFPYIRVIDKDFESNPSLTCTVEGMEHLLSLATKEDGWDCVIIDYYQKVNQSKKNYRAAEWEVLQDFTNLLDEYYKKISAPIVVLSQLRPSSKENTSFESRIKNGKSILNASTIALEIKKNENEFGHFETIWTCQKSRWGGEGDEVVTKWVKGRYKD